MYELWFRCRRPSAEAFVGSVKKERWTLESFACRGTSVKQWSCWWWQYCGLTKKQTKKKRINNNVDNVLVSQLLIKATYFLYRFNYLFCRIELINLRLLLSLVSFTAGNAEREKVKKKLKKAASVTMCKLWLCVFVHSFFRSKIWFVKLLVVKINIVSNYIIYYAV